MTQGKTGNSVQISRRHTLGLLGTILPLPLAGCSETGDEQDGAQAISFDEFLSEYGDLDRQAGDRFSQSYELVMNTPVDQLTIQDFEQARSGFNEARENYDELRSHAGDQATIQEDQTSDPEEILTTLHDYYDLMTEASALGYQGVDALLDQEDVFDAFSRSASAFELMEETYVEAQDLQKEINLYRDTIDADVEDLVSNWIAEHESEILEANSLFGDGATAFEERNYSTAREAFTNSSSAYQSLVENINSQFASEYPQESELYQLYGAVSYFVDQLATAAESLANSSRQRSEGEFEAAVEDENTAQEAYSAGVESLQSAREDLDILDERFSPPELPELEQQESVESQEEARGIVEGWLSENEDARQAQFNYLSTADDEYAAERYEDAADWYQTVAEDWAELEEAAADQADQYDHEFVTEMFTLIRDYFSALRNHAEAMEQAASARAADLDGEAQDWESDAQGYQAEAEELGTEIDERLADTESQ